LTWGPNPNQTRTMMKTRKMSLTPFSRSELSWTSASAFLRLSRKSVSCPFCCGHGCFCDGESCDGCGCGCGCGSDENDDAKSDADSSSSGDDGVNVHGVEQESDAVGEARAGGGNGEENGDEARSGDEEGNGAEGEIDAWVIAESRDSGSGSASHGFGSGCASFLV